MNKNIEQKISKKTEKIIKEVSICRRKAMEILANR